jgi:hypothetical protein
MDVTTRSKRSEGSSSLRVRWQARRERGAQHQSAAVAPPVPIASPSTSGTPSPEPIAPSPRRHPRGGAPLDHALYTCGCGFVFEAQVSTSVDCPHCGSYQAW